MLSIFQEDAIKPAAQFSLKSPFPLFAVLGDIVFCNLFYYFDLSFKLRSELFDLNAGLAGNTIY